jgi:hypothetical protein
MTNENRQLQNQPSARGAMVAAAGASTLILVGIACQLAQLGYGHLGSRNFWLFSMIGEGIWNMLAVRLGAPGMDQILLYWPLAIVGLGLALLLATQSASRSAKRSGSRLGDFDDR